MLLCKAYNLNTSNRMTKIDLCATLKKSIEEQDKMSNSAVLTAEAAETVPSREISFVQSTSTSIEDIASPSPSQGGNSHSM